ncbi:MAG: hypothetical protein OEZ22_02095 [Spirochaetia bacterium]|nr:hypothetical protein [Spirochaetia bacterium]
MQKSIDKINQFIEFLRVSLKFLLYLLPVLYLLNIILGKKFIFLNKIGSEVKDLLKTGTSSLELIIALILFTYLIKK